MDTKSSKCVHLVEGGTNGSQYVNMALMGKTSLGRVIHARKRQKTSFTNLETHGDGYGYLACDTRSSGVPNEIDPAGIVPIGNILVGNNIGFQTRTKGGKLSNVVSKLQRRLDRLEDLRSNGSNRLPGPLSSWAPTTAGNPDLLQAGPVAASKPLRVTKCPPPVAAPHGATPCPHGAAGGVRR